MCKYINKVVILILLGGVIFSQYQIQSIKGAIDIDNISKPNVSNSAENKIDSSDSNFHSNQTSLKLVKPSFSLTSEELVTKTITELGVEFSVNPDFNVSSVQTRKLDSGLEVQEVVVTPIGIDSTRVHFFKSSKGLDQSKQIKLNQNSSTTNSEFNPKYLGDTYVLQRTDYYSNNECKDITNFIPKGQFVYGAYYITCPTHAEGYDKIRQDIAESIVIL